MRPGTTRRDSVRVRCDATRRAARAALRCGTLQRSGRRQARKKEARASAYLRKCFCRVLHVSASARARVWLCLCACAARELARCRKARCDATECGVSRDAARRGAVRGDAARRRGGAARRGATLYESVTLRERAGARGCASVLTAIPNNAKRSLKLKTARLYMGAFCCLVLARHKQNAPIV